MRDFQSVQSHRDYLISIIHSRRSRRQKGIVVNFEAGDFDLDVELFKIGNGSLGGKARGLAFMANLLQRVSEIHEKYPKVRLSIPQSLVITTEGFDTFLAENDLKRFATRDAADEEVTEAFHKAAFPQPIADDLRAYLARVTYPLAVRSSSLLEDAKFRAYAGLYRTYMLPNDHASLDVRLKQLIAAIKLVYASTYFQSPKAFSRRVGHRTEEEKMAVIIQQLVGEHCGRHFYPAISGAAQSYNYYPFGAHEAGRRDRHHRPRPGQDRHGGGKGAALLSPPSAGPAPAFDGRRHPGQLPAVFLQPQTGRPLPGARDQRGCQPRKARGGDGRRRPAGEGLLRVFPARREPHPRNLRPGRLCRADLFRGAEVRPFSAGADARRRARPGPGGHRQPRGARVLREPEAVHRRPAGVRPAPAATDDGPRRTRAGGHRPRRDRRRAFCTSSQALGNGEKTEIADIVFVKPEAFDVGRTLEIAREIGQLNAALMAEQRKYLLIGPGRWGSADRWLGIPVSWAEICGVGAMVETTAAELKADPSQGSHFFHNITTLDITYCTVNPEKGDRLDWAWIAAQPRAAETRYVARVRLPHPFVIKADGRSSRCVMFVKEG